MKFSKYTLGVIFSFISGISWAIIPILSKLSNEQADINTIIFFRYFFSLPFVLGVYFYYQRVPKELKSFPLLGIPAAIFLCLNFYFYTKGIVYTSASNAQIFIQSGVLLFSLSSVFIFKEKINIKQFIGILISMVGFYIFYIGQNKGSIIEAANLKHGSFIVFISGFCWTIFAILQKKMTSRFKAENILIVIFSTAVLILLPSLKPQELANIDLYHWSLLFGCGFLTFTSYISLAWALKLLPAAQVSSIISLNPLLTIIILSLFSYLGILWYPTEFFNFLIYSGGFLVVAGVGIVNIFKPKGVEKNTPDFL